MVASFEGNMYVLVGCAKLVQVVLWDAGDALRKQHTDRISVWKRMFLLTFITRNITT